MILELGGLEKGDKWRPSKQQHCWDQPEYSEESGSLEVTCSHSDSNEKPSTNAGMKNSQKS